ncbi:hypothetical protein HYE82_28325 [Streptomyces sp. BR123]|uniref:hypothetical protein n=1 Tax=Streptomyces sp. BR123 TaxID=2749828 RepID=UPI0015C4BEE4|nr:hypothetical protein [Streptomyces sp. BR123]NXY98208.1 hypothetical protein [Streptomyces sp. BR123]
MALKTATCLLAACDECGQVLEHPDGGEIHFGTEAQARETALTYAWQELPGGRLVCDADEHQGLLEEHGRLQPGPGAMTLTFDAETDPEVWL